MGSSEGGEQSSAPESEGGGRGGKRNRGETSGGGTSGGELENKRGAALEGIGISHARRGRGTWAAWWAGLAHSLLLLSFFLFFFLHHLLL